MRGSKTNQTFSDYVFEMFACCHINLIVSLKCFRRNLINFAVWLISFWPCQLMWLEGTWRLAVGLLKLPYRPQRQTQAHLTGVCSKDLFVKSTSKVEAGLRCMSDKGSKRLHSLRSNLDRNFKVARAQSVKDLANMTEFSSRKRLQLAKAQRQTKNMQGFISPRLICASAQSLCQVEQLRLYLCPQMRRRTFRHCRQNLVGM